jgi:glycosyltransferase involved in cell wall biosynthesis
MRLAINAASAQIGGAVTYLRNMLPVLARAVASDDCGKILVWARPTLLEGLDILGVETLDPGSAVDALGATGIARRMWFDQWGLARRLRQQCADVLFSSANIGTLRCPVPQVLLVRNPVFFEPLLFERLRSATARARYIAERELILASVRVADRVLFPTRAMLDMVARHAGGPRSTWRVAPYGARHDLFRPRALGSTSSRPFTLLHVSTYYEHKNIGTLLTAMDRLERQSPGQYRLRMTAGFANVPAGPWKPALAEDRERYDHLERRGIALDVGSSSYGSLPDLYRSADVFVFPSYTESFGHPLVEAMASGLPVVAADVPVNREMCGDAAVYFAPFDASACADAVARVALDHSLAAQLRDRGLHRAAQFTWERHVESLWSAIRETLA